MRVGAVTVACNMQTPKYLIICVFLVLLGSFGDFRCSASARELPQEEVYYYQLLYHDRITCNTPQVKALQQIAMKLGRTRWDFSVNPCDNGEAWVLPAPGNRKMVKNLTCDCNTTPNTCHVLAIVMKRPNLTGVLPNEFANLTSLQILDLSFNYLNGSIPSSWASLPLIHLSLVGNRISGRIPPDLGKIITLQNLTLDQNQLQGPIPSSLGNLKNLNLLHLRANNLSGELPESLGNLTNLTEFLIDGNPITGKIPSFIGNWTMLRKLYMQGTSMEGLLPAVLSNLSNIIELVVSDLAGGDGKFPPLKNMFVIKYLVLRNLSISGELPDYIGQMELKRLDLSFNNLTGPIPSSYEALQSSIDYLYLTNNMLNGTIPSWILTSRKNMDLSYNNFTGLPAPSDCHQPNVNLVSSYSMTNNASITSCLRKNYPCPGKAKNYNVFINCGGNSVTVGTDDYGEDTITAPLFQSSDSKWAASTTGYFVGNERAEYIAKNSSLLAMENAQLYMTARLSPLSLRYYGLCLQKGTYTIRLHFAEIVFTDDNTYASVGRRLFDVSIQGEKVLMDFDIAKKANGTGKEVVESFNATVDETLEIHFQWEGKGTQSIPYPGSYGPLISAISVTPNFKPEIGTKKLYVGILVGIVVGCVVALLVVFVVVCLCLRRKTAADNELRGLELQGSSFSLKQIKEATENFSSVNKIGEGGFGPVYKGVLRDGSVIAVKQLSSKSKQGDREFINEIGMISALNHPNLVKLFGCCIEGNQLLLIYEYMENNSLARALFGPERYHLNLNWQTRRNICIGVAQGLAYLHEESRLKIVHRDIKATNILLDESLNVKISDFGLAKLDEQENTHISTRIAGTVGYMAPEYAMRGYLTDKADVYSFGVVVLEVVSGMSNTSYRPKEDCVYLLDLAYVLEEQGNLIELVDPNLSANYSKEEALQMLNISLICTNPSPTLRPTMSSVVSMLEGRMAAKIPSIQCGASRHREDLRFKSLERHSVSTSVASTPSVSLAFSQNSQEEKHPAISATSRLLPEHIE